VKAENGLNWRRAAKTAIASVCRVPASLALPRVQPYIVGYHRVVDDFPTAARTTLPSLLVSVRMLEQQLDWIGRHFHFASLDEIGERLEQDRPFDRPVAAVTFDDGYQDVYELAYPILLRKGIPAAFFVVTDMVGRCSWQIFDRLYRVLTQAFPTWDDAARRAGIELLRIGLSRAAAGVIGGAAHVETATGQLLARLSQAETLETIEALERHAGPLTAEMPALLDWDTIALMRRAGFTIGSHTRTHVWLPREDESRVAEELSGSRAELERRLGEPVAHLAYPAGEFNGGIVAAAGNAGYRFAYTICGHRDRGRRHLTVSRELLWEHSATDGHGRFSPAQMHCHVHGVFSSMNGCLQAH
jgi:peptidoglycan/xylan/chitin deacetylase (PgdA/CDA1 family)